MKGSRDGRLGVVAFPCEGQRQEGAVQAPPLVPGVLGQPDGVEGGRVGVTPWE